MVSSGGTRTRWECQLFTRRNRFAPHGDQFDTAVGVDFDDANNAHAACPAVEHHTGTLRNIHRSRISAHGAQQ